MKNRLRLSFIAVGLALTASQVFAVAPQYKITEVPTLEAEPQHKTAASRITRLFLSSHYKNFELNDSMSEKIFSRYLDFLDYRHSLLLKSEIQSLKALWGNVFDDALKVGDTQVAYRIYNQVMQARYERYAYALSQLEKPFDFSLADSFEIDRTEAPWPTTKADLNALWRSRVKYDLLNLILTGKTESEAKEKLAKRYNTAIRRIIQAKSEDVFQLYMIAFAQEVDPHTNYFSPRAAKDFQQNMNLSLEGIGAVLQMEDEYTIIRSLISGGPAEKSKRLKKGDRIIGVGQKKGEILDVVGWRLDDIVDKIKGPKGTDVRLEILPEGSSATSYIITIQRDKVRLEDSAVKDKIITLDNQKVAVLTVPSFYSGLAKDTFELIQKINEDKEIKGIIVDLRNNGGGALREADAMVGLFIDEGPVVQVRDSIDRISLDMDPIKGVVYNGPMTVLINQNSASASEIFAAAMQDYGRAVILGEQSFGKGTVQQYRGIERLYDSFEKPVGNITYTIQKFYRINGGSTQNRGVTPDILFPTGIDPKDTGESVMDNALPWDKIAPVDYTKLYDFSSVLPELILKHDERINSDREYSYILTDIERYKKEKDKKSISLNLEGRKEEKEDKESRKLARINERQKLAGKKAIDKLEDLPDDYEYPDPELDEAAMITLDLARHFK